MCRRGKEKVAEGGIVGKINPECSINVETDKKMGEWVLFA